MKTVISILRWIAVLPSGAWIAPSKKNATGLVLAVLILLMVGVVVGSRVSGVPTSVNLADQMVLGEMIGVPATAIYAVVIAWRGELGRVVGAAGVRRGPAL